MDTPPSAPLPAAPPSSATGTLPALFAPLGDPAAGPLLTRLGAVLRQPPLRRAWPWLLGTAGLGLAALLWAELAPAPQRLLYSELADGERAQVAAALDKAAIRYRIDPATGALSVGEDDLYKARMLVAQNGALAVPETGEQLLDKLPLGASRTLEGERLRAARERELELTIRQIDGVEGVRVHLAEAQQSVFVREAAPPTASVMVRLATGRQLGASQVVAIVNLVAGSVPELAPGAVKVIDQHGRLLSASGGAEADRLELQARIEDKLRRQLNELLTPMLGEGNFSSEIQAEIDMDQQTSARESYDRRGVVRSETLAQTGAGAGAPAAAIGVPGVLANTPPPAATASPGAPAGGAAAAPSPAAGPGESSATRTYELGREVAVTSATPGRLRRVSVAVALSEAAMRHARAGEADQIKALVAAAVGANPQRGDQVTVMVRKFETAPAAALPFYEAPWFAPVLRNAVALVAVVLVLLLGVRPAVRALGRGGGAGTPPGAPPAAATPAPPAPGIDEALLQRHIGLAQQLVDERPESALTALRQLLHDAPGAAGAA